MTLPLVDLRSSCDVPLGDADGACQSHHPGRCSVVVLGLELAAGDEQGG